LFDEREVEKEKNEKTQKKEKTKQKVMHPDLYPSITSFPIIYHTSPTHLTISTSLPPNTLKLSANSPAVLFVKGVIEIVKYYS